MRVSTPEETSGRRVAPIIVAARPAKPMNARDNSPAVTKAIGVPAKAPGT